MTCPAPHPPWCDLSRCGVAPERPTGTHCSRLVVLGPYPPSSVVAEVSIAQGPPVPGYPWSGRPFVALALGDGEDDRTGGVRAVGLIGADPAPARVAPGRMTDGPGHRDLLGR